MQSSEVLLHVSGNATNSLLKNSFGSSFRGALRHGISLFVGFWRGGILYSVRDGVFRSLFQQTANRDLVKASLSLFPEFFWPSVQRSYELGLRQCASFPT
jgi:hypothetical protein